MAVAFRVIDGGWQDDEAHIEALAFMDETAEQANAIYEAIQDLEATYRLRGRIVDPRWRRVEWTAARLMHKAEKARDEFVGLTGGAA